MPGSHWFEELADHLGEAYLRYSFTKGTANEVEFLVDQLGLREGSRVLDVGCGPGRHALALADRGCEVVGVDVSQRFVDLASAAQHPRARFVRGDARELGFDGEFDAVVSLCQGAFGLSGGPEGRTSPSAELDEPILEGMARALVPGGRLAVSAFSAYFRLRWWEDAEGHAFDAVDGVAAERTEVRDPDGRAHEVGLWTTCFTPRELRLLARTVGLVPEAVWSVGPGDYAARPPTVDSYEFLLVARSGPSTDPP